MIFSQFFCFFFSLLICVLFSVVARSFDLLPHERERQNWKREHRTSVMTSFQQAEQSNIAWMIRYQNTLQQTLQHNHFCSCLFFWWIVFRLQRVHMKSVLICTYVFCAFVCSQCFSRFLIIFFFIQRYLEWVRAWAQKHRKRTERRLTVKATQPKIKRQIARCMDMKCYDLDWVWHINNFFLYIFLYFIETKRMREERHSPDVFYALELFNLILQYLRYFSSVIE